MRTRLQERFSSECSKEITQENKQKKTSLQKDELDHSHTLDFFLELCWNDTLSKDEIDKRLSLLKDYPSLQKEVFQIDELFCLFEDDLATIPSLFFSLFTTYDQPQNNDFMQRYASKIRSLSQPDWNLLEEHIPNEDSPEFLIGLLVGFSLQIFPHATMDTRLKIQAIVARRLLHIVLKG